MNIYITFFLFFTSGFLISIVSNHLLLKFSQTLGIRNKNDVIVRWSNQSKPSLGGISLFLGFLVFTFLYLIIDSEKNIFSEITFLGLFFSGSIAFFMGLADDAYNTKPYFKLFIQIICGVIFLSTGTFIDLFHNNLFDYPITIIWVVVLMNSLNMLDNMDGITATSVFFALISCLCSAYFIGSINEIYWIFAIVSVLGALIGFLKFNVNPSKLFMGDSGSQFIGLFVAFFTIKYLWNLGAVTQNHSWVSLIITLTALTPAAADTLSVVINRLKEGKSPMIGGKDHTTHHLVYSGKSDKQVWYIFTFIGILSCLLSAAIVYLVIHGFVTWTIAFILFFIIVFIFLYRNTIKYNVPN